MEQSELKVNVFSFNKHKLHTKMLAQCSTKGSWSLSNAGNLWRANGPLRPPIQTRHYESSVGESCLLWCLYGAFVVPMWCLCTAVWLQASTLHYWGGLAAFPQYFWLSVTSYLIAVPDLAVLRTRHTQTVGPGTTGGPWDVLKKKKKGDRACKMMF